MVSPFRPFFALEGMRAVSKHLMQMRIASSFILHQEDFVEFLPESCANGVFFIQLLVVRFL